MLDIMRRQKRLKLILWVVILGLALGMLLFFVPGGNMGSDSTDSVAATVDGHDISMRDYLVAYRRVYDRYRKNTKTPQEIERLRSELPQGVLFGLVSEKVKEIVAKRFGIVVTPAEIRDAIKEYPGLQYKGQFIGVETYLAVLAQNNRSAEDFEAEIRQQVLEKKLRYVLTDSLNIADRDLQEEFSREHRKTQVDYALFKVEEYKKRVKPTEADLQSFFTKHKDQYRVMEKRRAQFLVVPAGQFLSNLDDTIEAAHILFRVSPGAKDAEVKAKAEDIIKRAKAGEDFSALAAKYSEDKESAGKGGVLPPFHRGGPAGKEFDDAAFSLKPDQISDPIRTPQGYEIIKVLRHTSPSQQARSEDLKKAQDLAKQKAEEAARLLAKQNDFTQVSAQLGVKTVIKDTPPLSKSDFPFNFGITLDMRNEMFEIKAINSIGKVVQSIDGYAIPKLLEVQLPKPGDFAASRNAIEQDCIDEKAKELLQTDAKKLSEEARKQSSLAKAAKEMKMSVKKSQEFAVSGTPDPEIGTDTPFNRAAFELEPGGVSDPQNINDKITAVFQVTSRTPFDDAAFEKEKAGLREKLLQSLREPYLLEYLQKAADQLDKEKKIELNLKAVKRASTEY
jgi:peptidyl-prolyl cis-trans isomerase D